MMKSHWNHEPHRRGSRREAGRERARARISTAARSSMAARRLSENNLRSLAVFMAWRAFLQSHVTGHRSHLALCRERKFSAEDPQTLWSRVPAGVHGSLSPLAAPAACTRHSRAISAVQAAASFAPAQAPFPPRAGLRGQDVAVLVRVVTESLCNSLRSQPDPPKMRWINLTAVTLAHCHCECTRRSCLLDP